MLGGIGSLVLILSSSLLLSSCGDIDEVKFNDKILIASRQEAYEVAVGRGTFYVLAGTYKRIPPGFCSDLDGNLSIFSIGELLRRNPSLLTLRSRREALKQQVEFKRRHSILYDPDLEI
jgi:hypothetical protein